MEETTIKTSREELEKAYIELGNLLPVINKNVDFKNHCYWRMANDNACYKKWNEEVDKPFYKNASDELLYHSIKLLTRMICNYDEVSRLNKLSLRYRNIT